VKKIALDSGFWHLGHFAKDYHALFGENPSETLRRPTS
jgi:AraC family transcriptional regulator, ethanolamine operon transcriptional activator